MEASLANCSKGKKQLQALHSEPTELDMLLTLDLQDNCRVFAEPKWSKMVRIVLQ